MKLLSLALLAALFLLGACAPPTTQAPAAPKSAAEAPPAGQPIVLKAVSTWVRNASFNDGFFTWVELVNKRAQGQLRIDFVGGPEAVPTFEGFNSLKQGAFDILNTSSGFHADAVPESMSMQFVFAPPADIRRTGAIDELDKVFQTRTGVKFVGTPECCTRFRFYLKKRISGLDDLKGLRIRSIPLWKPIVEKFDGVVVTMATEEIYSALERGVLDGYVNPSYGQVDFNFPDVVKFWIEPGFQQTYATGLMNLNSWNKLPANLQNLLLETVQEAEKAGVDYYQKKAADEQAIWVQKGMQKIELGAADKDRLQKLASDLGFEYMAQQKAADPAAVQKLRQLLEKLPR